MIIKADTKQSSMYYSCNEYMKALYHTSSMVDPLDIKYASVPADIKDDLEEFTSHSDMKLGNVLVLSLDACICNMYGEHYFFGSKLDRKLNLPSRCTRVGISIDKCNPDGLWLKLTPISDNVLGLWLDARDLCTSDGRVYNPISKYNESDMSDFADVALTYNPKSVLFFESEDKELSRLFLLKLKLLCHSKGISFMTCNVVEGKREEILHNMGVEVV